MGVDLMTYRCRVGSFVSCLSAGDGQKAGDGQGAAVRQGAANGQDPDVMFLFGSLSKLIKLFISLTFIGMLIMVVIVSNPDPPDTSTGVDITTYPCRVGMFVPGGGCGSMSLFITFDRVVNLLGSLTLVRILLFMAGVEQNPGPADKFIFRYQYLLVEIGTDVMRKVFDFQVGSDFVKHLSANKNKFNKKLQSLITAKIITADQARYLPPIDTSPKSANFDITLLTCLLRNVCGLPYHKPEWWKNPPSTDFSLEAELARLKQCRNDLQHSGTVFIAEADLTVKWNELSRILIRLSAVCGIPNLSSRINNAESMDIDQELKKRLDQALKACTDMDKLLDRGIEELLLGQSEIKDGQSEIKDGQSEIKDGQSEIKDGQSEIKDGQSEIKDGQSEIKDGQSEIKDGQSEIKDGQSEIKDGQSEIKDGQSEIKDGQSEIKDGQSEIKDGQSEIKDGQSEIKDGQSEIKDGQSEIKDGQSEIKDGQSEIKERIQEIGNTLRERYPTNMDMESDLRNRLVKIYKEECCTLPVSPLCDEDEDEVEILSIYKPPSLHHVPYHRTEEKEEKDSISSYKEIFCKDNRTFRKIYITGDAGVGKTSFCKRMTFLWCKSQCGESVGDKSVQNDIDFMAKFDFVFYVSLRDTRRKDVLMMIVEQLFGYENEHKQKETCDSVENILRNNECIIIMDALDEWTPAESGKINIKLLSDKCSFVTTCRPYKIENERLSHRDLDRQVQITGIKESSTECYVREILNHIGANKDDMEPNDFIRDVNKCGLQEQLRIPIITSHLVAVWYDHKLTDMSRALIYSNIVDMLLKRAEKRKGIELPSSAESKIQFPDSLSELFYFKKHISFLKKICLLSFNLLFKQDKCLSELIFTTEQLESEPYCISANEMNFLCKFGILSKSKVISGFGKREQKLSYLHKTYLEYFAALFVSSFDFDNVFDNVVQKWTTINDVVQFEIFFIFFVGLSTHKSKFLFENMYQTISDDLSMCRKKSSLYRKNATFHNDSFSYSTQIESLQTMVINCFKEVSRSNDPNISFKLEDFTFDIYSSVHNDTSYDDHLKQILLLNTTCVKSIHSVDGKYYDEFDQIKNLQCLHVSEVWPYDVKFTECMLQNQSTLHTVCIEGYSESVSLIPDLHVRSLQYLTSLSLDGVKMQHNSLHNLVKFLSDNILFENIQLSLVCCDDHQDDDSDCTSTLNLPHHTKLTSLCLDFVNILCNNVNNSSLKSITLFPLTERIVSGYIDVFNCTKDSQLEHLGIHGKDMLDYYTLTHTVNTLPYIKSLTLCDMELADDVLLQLHPDVTQVEIELEYVTMSRQCFQCFIESFVNNKSVIKVELYVCKITSVDGETHRELSEEELWKEKEESWKESVDYMSKYLTSIPTVNITYKDDRSLCFETRSCQ